MPRVVAGLAAGDLPSADRIVEWASKCGYHLDIVTDDPAQAEAERLQRLGECDALLVMVTPRWAASTICRGMLHHAHALHRRVFPIIVSSTGELIIGSSGSQLLLNDTESTGLERLATEITASFKAALITRSAYRFCAFISYSHRDKREARWLHRAIEVFRIPTPLVGKSTTFSRVGRKVGKAFRDDEELKGASDLGALLQGALEESETLVVVCSPSAARSAYVNEEIASFKRLGRASRIIPVIIAGVPHDAEQECFPAALKSGAEADGSSRAAEPLAVDLREHGRRRTVLKVIAGITGLEFDELERRDLRRRSVQRRVIGGSVAAALVALLTASVIIRQNVGQQAILDRAARVLPERRALLAAQLALASLPTASDLLPTTSGATATLKASGYAFPTRLINPSTSFSEVLFTADTRMITRAHSGRVQVWDVNTAMPLMAFDHTYYGGPTTFEFLTLSPDMTRLITSNVTGAPQLWNATEGAWIGEIGFEDASDFPKFSADGTRILVTAHASPSTVHDTDGRLVANLRAATRGMLSADGSRVVLEMDNGAAVELWDGFAPKQLTRFPGARLSDVKLAPDGKRLVVNTRSSAELWDSSTGKRLATLGESATAYQLEMSADGARIATLSTGGEVALWDTANGQRLAIIASHADTVRFSASDEFVVTQQADATSRIHEARTGKLVRAIGEPYESAGGLYFIPGRERVALLTRTIGLTLRDMRSGALIAQLAGDNEAYLPKISQDGSIIQAKDANHWVKMWSAETGAFIGALSAPREGHRWLLDRNNRNAATISVEGTLRLRHLYADLDPTPAALRSRVCRDNRDVIGAFPATERTAETPSGRELRGRPWHPCDWQGLRSLEGWLQLVRYLGTLAGLHWDYEPWETAASDRWRKRAPGVSR